MAVKSAPAGGSMAPKDPFKNSDESKQKRQVFGRPSSVSRFMPVTFKNDEVISNIAMRKCVKNVVNCIESRTRRGERYHRTVLSITGSSSGP